MHPCNTAAAAGAPVVIAAAGSSVADRGRSRQAWSPTAGRCGPCRGSWSTSAKENAMWGPPNKRAPWASVRTTLGLLAIL